MLDSESRDIGSIPLPAANMTKVVDLAKFREKLDKQEEEEEFVRTLSDAQVDRLLYATVVGREDVPTEEEMLAVLTWAHDVTVRAVILNLIYEGKVTVTWDGTDIRVTAAED